ncbi:hypothetical protein [Streptomyces mirabilis]|uniref:hypothetical protein n=1 Tax=Streptomyces mirabilis TaxID=68239 RepID=UPI0033F957A5
MSPLTIAIGLIAFCAVAGLCAGLPDRWICGLLALATLAAGCDAAYHGSDLWAVIFLVGGALLTGAAAHAIVTSGRTRGQQ